MKKLYIVITCAVLVIIAGSLYALRPLEVPVAVPIAEVPAEVSPAAMETRYEVIPEESSVSYTLPEMLRGKPFTVVGSTKAVSGTLTLGESGPSGEIKIDGATLKTDSENRDRAVGRFILEVEKPENQFIIFKIDRLTGPADATEVGGWITIHGITKPVVFKGAQEMIGEGMLRIKASAVIKRADFNLVIPSISFVADVGEEVRLDADIAFGVR